MISGRLSLAAALAVLAFGCENELGKCDQEAANELVYGRGNLVATKGQALMHDSCGQGAFCHSAAAEGKVRQGAPGSLNFDMLPRASGLPDVLDQRDEIWESVLNGSMPPKEFVTGDGDWTFSVKRSADEPRLPPLSTDAGKAVLRNWLACGAPIVVDTSVPSWARPASAGGSATWADLHSELIAPRCALSGCHDKRSASSAGDLDLSERCAARRALLATGPCGEPRLKPGDVTSFLVDKIESAAPRCGTRMPPSGAFSAAEAASVRAWIMAGAVAEDCP